MRLTFFIFLCGWRCIGWGRNQSQLWCKGWNCREIANFITPEVQLHLQVVTVPRKNEKRFCRRRHWTETPCFNFFTIPSRAVLFSKGAISTCSDTRWPWTESTGLAASLQVCSEILLENGSRTDRAIRKLLLRIKTHCLHFHIMSALTQPSV